MATWIRMVNLAMNQPFGNPDGQGHCHPGCDYAGPEGTPVLAASSGVVTAGYQSWDGGFGNFPCAIYHPDDDVTTLVGHMDSVLVVVGQQVVTGQQIGTLGSQGQSTGPHTHQEIRHGNTPYGWYGDGITFDIDGWYYAKGAYNQAPEHQNPAPLSWADRMKIGALQKTIGVKVDMAWGPQTDTKLSQVRDYYFNKNRKSQMIVNLQNLWGVPADGYWGPTTDKAYNVWRWCFLNK